MRRGLYSGESSSASHIGSSFRGLSEHEDYDDDETQAPTPPPENNEVEFEVEQLAPDGRTILYLSRAEYVLLFSIFYCIYFCLSKHSTFNKNLI